MRIHCLCRLSDHVVSQNGLVPLRTSYSASPLYHSNQRGFSSSSLVGGPGASRWSVTATASNGNLLSASQQPQQQQQQWQHSRFSLGPPRTADNNSSSSVAGGYGAAVLHRHMHMHTRMRSAPVGSGASNSSSASALSPRAVSVGGGAASSGSEVLDVNSDHEAGVTCLIAAPESWSLDGLSDPTGCPLLTVAAEEVTTLAELTQRCWVSACVGSSSMLLLLVYSCSWLYAHVTRLLCCNATGVMKAVTWFEQHSVARLSLRVVRTT
jgi:hypothetical protein